MSIEGVSTENIFGWKSQYERVIRSYQRVINHRELMCNSDEFIKDGIDEILFFMILSYSMRDWLIESSGIEKDWIDQRITDCKPMLICKDICNRTKHFSIDRNPFKKHFSIRRESVVSFGTKCDKYAWVVLADERYDLFYLAHQCMEFWKNLIKENDFPILGAQKDFLDRLQGL